MCGLHQALNSGESRSVRSNAHDAFWGPQPLNRGYTAQQAGTRTTHQQLSPEALGVVGPGKGALPASSHTPREPTRIGKRVAVESSEWELCAAEKNGNAGCVISLTLFVERGNRDRCVCVCCSLSGTLKNPK